MSHGSSQMHHSYDMTHDHSYDMTHDSYSVNMSHESCHMSDVAHVNESCHTYGVATISRMLKNICLFAEYRSLL